jgi:hypothetical protein
MTTLNDIAREFVRLRDLQHCTQFCDVGISLKEFDRRWQKLKDDCFEFANPPSWLIHLKAALNFHGSRKGDHAAALQHWHLACQGADVFWPTDEQGVQARTLGIPRDAGIHSTLDDGIDTLTPWLEGLDLEHERDPSQPFFKQTK